MDISGKSVLITGSAVRVGRHIALACAGRGASVIIHCNRSKAEAEKTLRESRGINPAGRHRLVVADLSCPDGAQKLFDQIEQIPAVLINNASVFERALFQHESPADARRQFEINFWAPVELTRLFARKNDDSGCVINLIDQRVTKNDGESFSYSISKKALAAATEAAAIHLAPRIRVNAVAPGPVLPPPGMPESDMELSIASTPLKKKVELDDIAAACLFLIANESITGQTVFVDCGQHLV